MRRRWVVLGGVLLALLVAPFLLAGWALKSERGLRFALGQLDRVPGLRIEASAVQGTLAGPLHIGRLRVDHDAVRIEASDLLLELRLRSLLAGNVRLDQLAAGRLDVELKTGEEQPPEAPRFLPRFLEIEAPDVRLEDVALTLANGDRFEVATLRGALAMTRWRIVLTDLVVEDPAGRVDGTLALRATQPLGLRFAAHGHWRLPDQRTYRFAASARGHLDRLGTTITLAEPAELSFIGNALTLTAGPRLVGTLRFTDFDGSPWVEAGQWPRASGSIALDAGPSAIGLDGTVISEALGEGPLRLQGNGRWADGTIEVGSLRAWMPRSGLAVSATGTVKLADPAPELDLTGEWAALRWPLAGEPVFESPAGALTLRGALPYAFELTANARAPDLPAADFTAAGRVDREQIVLERLDGRAFRGQVSGDGRLSWTGEQRWDARVKARDVDIASVRPDLPGRLSLTASIEGRGFTSASPWTARLASLSGTVLGRALDGRGEVSHRNGEFELRGVRIANGPSHAAVEGRWGRLVDLRWNADVRDLALVLPRLSGTLVSSGRLQGPPQRPAIVGELRVRQLGFGDLSAQSLDVDVDADLSSDRSSRVDLRASSLDLGVANLDRVRLQASGLASDHSIALEFSSPGGETQRMPAFRGRIAASGTYEAERAAWRGRLDEATLALPDGESSLLQTASVEAGRDLVRVDTICLASGEARLCAEGEWQAEPASWRLIYSAQDWPLRRLLRSLLGWREFDGRLQASGWAEQRPGTDWVGGTTVYLDDPVLDIPRNQFRTERVRLGSGRLDVYAEPAELRASVDLDLAEGTEGTFVRGQATARRAPGAAPADYPLNGEVRVESPAITGLSVLVPEIDRSAGRLDASLAMAGTLGNPRFDGEFHVRDGRLDMYRTNLTLSELTLDGRFVGSELVFEGRGKAASGELTLDGRFDWPDGVMSGAMRLRGEQLRLADTPEYRIVASPDLTIRAGPQGYDVTGEVLIPLARIRPRDLSTTVRTSPDERIVGLETEDAGPSTVERITSRVRIVLGDDVRVDSYGLKARLAGDVTVVMRPDDVVRGDGSIRVEEGEYKAFGQFVKIVRGVLSYRMTPLDEPTLDLVGQREIKQEDIVVSINVRGTLSNPFVTLSSEPPMPENEALSYLIMGRSLDTLQSGEAASLDRAAESLALSGGGLLLGGIGSRIGLDEVTVEQRGADNAEVVLGKYLSPKLFISYGISIAEAINTVKLRYTLNERWALKAEAGLVQGADVEFKIER